MGDRDAGCAEPPGMPVRCCTCFRAPPVVWSAAIRAGTTCYQPGALTGQSPTHRQRPIASCRRPLTLSHGHEATAVTAACRSPGNPPGASSERCIDNDSAPLRTTITNPPESGFSGIGSRRPRACAYELRLRGTRSSPASLCWPSQDNHALPALHPCVTAMPDRPRE